MACDNFITDHLIVIASKDEISANEWREFVEDHWPKLMWRNSKMIVLAGIHGDEMGNYGEKDEGILDDNKRQIKKIREDFYADMKSNNMKVKLMDMGEHSKESETNGDDMLDEEKLVKKILEKNPTVIVLAFCYTKESKLNEALKKAGVFPTMFLKRTEEEYPTPCDGRCTCLA